MPLQDQAYIANGVANANGYNAGNGATGIQLGNVNIYDVVPLTLQVANIAASQSPAAAALTLAAGTGASAKTVNGVACIQIDIARALRITSGGNDSGITFNVVGYDQYGVAMTENITGANAGIATGAKAWFSIASITPSAAVASTCSVGTADIFGLPFLLKNKGYCLGVQWNNTLAKDAGTLTVGDSTNPATHITGDVRGTYAPSTGASDGSKRLVFTQIIPAAQTVSATAASVFGITQV